MREATIIRADGSKDTIVTYNVNDFPLYQLNTKALNVRRKKKNTKQYIYTFATFDIETTTIDNGTDQPYGFMYHWQMDIGGLVVTGRYWSEFVKFMQRLQVYFNLNPERHLVIYVHNLAYEFQFIRDFLKKYFGGFEVFARARRKPISVRTESGFEFRCSYILTNMNLAAATKNEYGVIHPKAKGDLDFKVFRTPKTYLNDTEFGYTVSDVVSLYELIECKMKNEKDNLETIPLTSTGYVRRECRKACLENKRYYEFMRKLELKETTYIMLKEAGRGGNTHANRNMSGRIWSDCDSDDVVSSYPAQIELRKFPMSNFMPYGEIESMDEFNRLLHEKACLFHLTLTNLRLKNNVAMPYIASAKCLAYKNPKFDNGRVLSADMVRITVNDIDYKIIRSEYKWDSMQIDDMLIAHYDYLPEELRRVTMDFFKDKCKLKDKIKGLESKKEESGLTDQEAEDLKFTDYLYAKSKNRLNGIFGMMYTDPVRTEISIDNNGEWVETLPNVSEALHKAAISRQNFVFYAWGVWTTSWARLTLEELINATNKGEGVCIYCDTDSSKSVSAERKYIDMLNTLTMRRADKLHAYYDLNGKRYYMGIYEHENKEPIRKFKTLGAKKYVYADADGLHVTISGVNKEKGAAELKDINNFKPGFIFREAGGSTLYYNDCSIYDLTVDGQTFTTASNIGMVDSTYEVGITGEYADLIGYDIILDEDLEEYA